MPAPSGSTLRNKPHGLAHWMRKTLAECDKVAADFAPDPVHDLRVAIRRCRSLADGFISLDPDPDWKRMKKAAKPLFSALGALRDVQVMGDWVRKLAPAEDPVAKALLDHLAQREQDLKNGAIAALQGFDRQKWQDWCGSLPARSRRLPLESLAFQHMALERWEEARRLHAAALRSRSGAALHRARIGIKRFRYTLENFLPRRHAAWGKKLAHLQDLLGDVHDLDLLWQLAQQIHAFVDAETQSRWRRRIVEERHRRVEEYRVLTTGKRGLWLEWRAGLPQHDKLRAAGIAKLAAWAAFRDPEFPQTRTVSRLALKIFDGLHTNGARPEGSRQRTRTVLHAAALARDAGRFKADRKHQKHSYKQIMKLDPPLGWSREDLRLAALAARYHRGALPNAKQKLFDTLSPSERQETNLLAGILRVAGTLAQSSAAAVHVQNSGPVMLIEADGLDEFGAAAARLAGDRHLLELACGKPVMIRKSPQAQ
jgi:CHAD domain-containing protein